MLKFTAHSLAVGSLDAEAIIASLATENEKAIARCIAGTEIGFLRSDTHSRLSYGPSPARMRDATVSRGELIDWLMERGFFGEPEGLADDAIEFGEDALALLLMLDEAAFEHAALFVQVFTSKKLALMKHSMAEAWHYYRTHGITGKIGTEVDIQEGVDGKWRPKHEVKGITHPLDEITRPPAMKKNLHNLHVSRDSEKKK